MTLELFVLIAIVFLFNLAPAFAPPTWTVLVLFSLNSHLSPFLLVTFGALAAASGRFILAHATGLLRNKISRKTKENLLLVGRVLERNPKGKFVSLMLFALSPLPSAQLFEAAGLMGMRLLPLTALFFSGRIISYSIYVTGGTTLKEQGLSELIVNNLKSPVGIGIQILSLFGIYLLTKIDWSLRLHKHR